MRTNTKCKTQADISRGHTAMSAHLMILRIFHQLTDGQFNSIADLGTERGGHDNTAHLRDPHSLLQIQQVQSLQRRFLGVELRYSKLFLLRLDFLTDDRKRVRAVGEKGVRRCQARTHAQLEQNLV
jgi:hypothetical protein